MGTSMEKEKAIYVFADFGPFHNEQVGTIYVTQTREKEFYSFEYAPSWLDNQPMMLDPDLRLYGGRQYINDDKTVFGIFADSCPDRWGRRLINRSEELRARKVGEKPHKLLESDYLLGVYDRARMGGLRFKTDPDGDFLSDNKEYVMPPWTSLSDLEQAAAAFENNGTRLGERWLKRLLARGAALGGARPKATIVAEDGALWIAKFPSKYDDFNSGAWEMVIHELALMCGLNVSEAKAEQLSELGTTFLVKRFDREGGRRIHFSSALTMLGKKDGANADDGSSYLEIVSFLKANGAKPKRDLEELWRRIVFGMAVSNTSDHLGNHGFLLSDEGWELSPLYGVNPDICGEYLSLNVDSEHSKIDFELAIDAAPLYGIDKKKAVEYVEEVKKTVGHNWQLFAKNYGIGGSEIDRMGPAFRECEK